MTQTVPGRRRRSATWPAPTVAILILIPFLVEAVFVFIPAVQGIWYSFTKWNGIGDPTFVGIDNYVRLTSDEIFLGALRNTAIWVLLFGGLSFIVGLAAALLLQSERRGVGVYRTILFLPVVFSLVVTSLVWSAYFQPDGLLNQTLRAVGLGDWTRVWLGDPETALYAIIVAALWRQIGYIMVLFLAGLKAIDPTLVEAARMDGASAWQRLRYITLPQLRSVNLVVVSVLVIDSLRSFDVVYAMTGGGPFNSSEILSTYMFTTAFQTRALGYGSAIAVIIFVLALGVIISYLVRAFSEERES